MLLKVEVLAECLAAEGTLLALQELDTKPEQHKEALRAKVPTAETSNLKKNEAPRPIKYSNLRPRFRRGIHRFVLINPKPTRSLLKAH